MKKLIAYNSIDQFRNVIKEMDHAQFIGLDANGDAMYDRGLPKPTVKFKGTVKLHGTNAGVVMCNNEMWAQSRNNIITPQSDNAGFADFVEANKSSFENIFDQFFKNNPDVTTDKAVCYYGEYCGGNIQKGVALTKMEKAFFIFDICVVDLEDERESNGDWKRQWFDSSGYRNTDSKIYNIEDYPTWEMEIDFNNPGLVQNDLIALTIAVEDECPVGKAFGHSGVGEGIVWKANNNGKRYTFKVKGEKHSVSKVKVLAAVDTDKLNSVNEFVDYAVTANRLEQAIQTHCGDQLNIRQLGEVIRWVLADVRKEESDTMESNGLTEKDVNKSISDRVRVMFSDRLNREAGLVPA